MASDFRCTAAPPVAAGESESAVLAARSQALGTLKLYEGTVQQD
jgi:hypothetical protein